MDPVVDPPTKRRRSGLQKKGSTSYDRSLFANAECEKLFHNTIVRKTIIKGRMIDFNFFKGIDIDLEGWFNRMGWLPALKLRPKVYPNLVRYFFANLHTKTYPDHIWSMVKGHTIRLTCTQINSILGTSDEGKRLISTKSVPEYDWFSLSEAVREICETPPALANTLPSANQLSMPMRIVHHIITSIIFPREGRRDRVSYDEICLLFCIKRGIPVNFGFLILTHLTKVDGKQKFALPYELLLTQFFEHFGVNFEGEVIDEKPLYIYKDQSLVNMGYRLIDGSWVKLIKSDKDEAIERISEPPHQPHLPSSSSPGPSHVNPEPAPATTSLRTDQLAPLFEHMSNLGKQMETLQDSLNMFSANVSDRLTSLEKRIANIEADAVVGHGDITVEQLQGMFTCVDQMSTWHDTLGQKVDRCLKVLRQAARGGAEHVQEMLNMINNLTVTHQKLLKDHKNLEDEDLKKTLMSFMRWQMEQWHKRWPIPAEPEAPSQSAPPPKARVDDL